MRSIDKFMLKTIWASARPALALGNLAIIQSSSTCSTHRMRAMLLRLIALEMCSPVQVNPGALAWGLRLPSMALTGSLAGGWGLPKSLHAEQGKPSRLRQEH